MKSVEPAHKSGSEFDSENFVSRIMMYVRPRMCHVIVECGKWEKWRPDQLHAVVCRRLGYNLLECVTVLMHAADAASGHNMFPSSLLSKWFRQSNLYAIVETNCLPVEIEMETTDRN